VGYASRMGLGVPELLIILAILLLVFGAKRLPEIGRSLGGGMREFKDSVTSKSKADEIEENGLPAAPAPVVPEAENDPAAHPRS
jgi:sec-independent protein translocase protein TatA